ncbi:MAG: DNA polymerase III subunit beta [Prevotella sp.]|uniref:Beta sliding clamp n=1 Tax=Segatella cerevisiae TaxID=2053716 RepID=A0ABT1BV89_9BACT|nr:DNA polymerase III subunit beta [Segatella cerevisiae]MCI1246865.1 DNA polymerase III subunit beta [Prevotella sp.]MCO6025011.1 DNA polymerase III subunit beta [Segatella cerevisiae]
MRFTISSTALSSCLSTLSKVINSKNSLPILDCFLFQVSKGTLSITASDSENIIKSTLKLDSSEGDGNFAIPSRTIIDAVKELPEQPLNFDIDTDTYNVKVTYQNGLYNFTAQNAEEYPQAQTLDGDTTTITIDAGVLVDNLTRSLFATADDELRPVMNGIYFDLTPESLNIVASDGHKLVRNKFFSIKSETPTAFILPKKPSTLLKNILNRESGDVVIRFNNRNSEIKFDGGILNCRLIEGRYPNYNSVIPTDNPNKLTVDRRSLLSALRRVVPFASESSELVRFQLGTGKLELNSEDLDFATSAKEQLTCDYSGQAMSIGFKGTSLLEILTNLESDEVIMELADPSRAGIVYPATQPENGEVLMLLMPMLLND